MRMPQGPLKNVGEHPLKVALHTDVVVTVTVTVVPEQAYALLRRAEQTTNNVEKGLVTALFFRALV